MTQPSKPNHSTSTSTSPSTSAFSRHQRVLLYTGTILLTGLAFQLTADAYVGQRLLEWATQNIVVGLGIACIVIALGASFFRPDLAKQAIYVALICVAIFFVVQAGSTLEGLFRAG